MNLFILYIVFYFLRAVFLGGVNVADYPALYIHAVNELARFVGENYSNVPCIINTMGFSSGKFYIYNNRIIY